MNSTKIGLLALALGMMLCSARLQANPLVQFPDGPAAWTIDVSASQANSSAPAPWAGSMSKVEVTQNAEERHYTITYMNGKSRDVWGLAGTNLLVTEDPNGTPFITPPTAYFSLPFPSTVFSWLSPANLAEKDPVTHGDKMCFHYKSTTTISDMVGLKIVTTTVPVEAWIDSKTLLPVALDDGTELANFTFLPPPETPLHLPAKYTKLVAAYRTNMGIHPAKSQVAQ